MAEVALPTPPPSIKARPIIRDQLRHIAKNARPTFDASKHLEFQKPSKVLQLTDIGMKEDAGISPVALSEPFPMFTKESINHMRDEIFQEEVWENCLHSTDFAGCQLRGHSPKYTPFMYQAWHDPKTLAIISKIAGVDLVPVMDCEIGNINVSVQDDIHGNKEKMANQDADDLPVCKWHYDSYPFVCIVMMSDTTGMVGGETAVQSGTGEIMKIRGPQMGHAVVMQGRVISHQALAAIGGTERITMVTAFRPRDPFIHEDSKLALIKTMTDNSELFFQWTEYRTVTLQKRLEGMLELLRAEHKAGKQTDVKRIKEFLKTQEEWLRITNGEI